MFDNGIPALTDLKGQNRAVRLLNRIQERELGGLVFLFYGPAGVGKKTAALALASKALCRNESNNASEPGFGFEPVNNTEKSKSACGVCGSCRKIIGESHQDLAIIEPLEGKKTVSASQARQFIKTLLFKPQESNVRVVIIPDAENLTPEAANILLKTLEEPPLHTAIILTTSDQKALPSTVLSRCQKLAFRPIDREIIAGELIDRRGLNRQQAETAADLAAGSMAGALALDVEEERQKRDNFLHELSRVNKKRVGAIIDLVQNISADRDRSLQFMDVLATWFRDLVVLSSGATEKILVNRDKSADLIKRSAEEPSLIWLKRLEAVLEAKSAAKANANYRLNLEAMLLNLIMADREVV